MKKYVIGITGGIGAGKSRILDLLKNKYDALVILTDETAHKIMEPGEKGYEALLAEFGTQILDLEFKIDKKILSRMIFEHPQWKKKVDQIIHPMVWDEVKKMIEETEKKLCVVESALLTRENSDFFDDIWYVYTSEDTRIMRLMENRGYSREKSIAIMKNQQSDREFRSFCDAVIDNNGSVSEVELEIDKLVHSLLP